MSSLYPHPIITLAPLLRHVLTILPDRMNRRKADFKFVYKYLEDEL